ncbi:cobalamin synthesis protein P47K [Planococcus antarcticus DSM 14505]|uniref:Cobalamin synthesis protein P47K n=1 Tax=Planococcus antarcticus DSM 14505 TaxID=1185653 RepID=A0AA87IIQ5_9BACL|nr:cobalamin synthesis protein P47K [Planococcus antarcticus DSM 14505]
MPGYHEHQPETEEYGITSFVYNRKLPFHSERFYQLMYTLRKNVVRVKGIAWCATRNNLALSVSQAGPSISIEPVSYWVACLQEWEQK